MPPSIKNLFLFTAKYPYGKGESFIENELKILSENFHTIYLLPAENTEYARVVPSNVKVINWSTDYKYNGLKTAIKFGGLFLKIFFIELYNSSQKIKIFKNLTAFRSTLLQNIAKAQHVKKYLSTHQPATTFYYTFWFDDWATILGILKIKKIIPDYYARTHGFDLYAERRTNGIIPYRNFQLKTVKKIFPVSIDGVNYLSKNYPEYISKIKLSHLCVFDNGENPLPSKDGLVVVSCSNLIPLKRVDLIIDVLQHIKNKVHWIHFGDGYLKNDLLEKAKLLPDNITVDFKGQTANSEILNFYKQVEINLFVHLSETEGGVPISIQEAASFGIPILATNVGGIPEIVNEITGILIDKKVDVLKTAEIINNFNLTEKNSLEFRKGVKRFWLDNFDAKINYTLFFKQLTE